jgi:large conductance mechanosensitive channel
MDSLTSLTENTISFGQDTFSDFVKFLTQTGVIALAVATIIGLYVSELSTGFVDAFVSPIINNILGGEAQKNLESYVVDLFGVKFKVGKFISLVIKFFILLVILFLIVRFVPKLTKKYVIGD